MVKFQPALRSTGRPDSQADQPPVSILIHFQIRMPGAGNRTIRIILVAENRVMRTWLIRSKRRIRSLHGNHVPIFCTTLCKQQIVFSIQLINMRSLRTDSTAAMADTHALRQLFSRVWINFAHKNTISALFVSGRRSKVNILTVKQQGRINSSLVNPYRLRPLSINITGMYDQMPLM